jgi:hypothetical protein
MSIEAFFQPGRHCDSVRHADCFSSLMMARIIFVSFGRRSRVCEGADEVCADALGDFLHEVAATRKKASHLHSRVRFLDALRVRARVLAALQDGMANI